MHHVPAVGEQLDRDPIGTKSISFPAKVSRIGEGVRVKAEFSINRKDFGVVYEGMRDNLIRDDVVIKLSLNAK